MECIYNLRMCERFSTIFHRIEIGLNTMGKSSILMTTISQISFLWNNSFGVYSVVALFWSQNSKQQTVAFTTMIFHFRINSFELADFAFSVFFLFLFCHHQQNNCNRYRIELAQFELWLFDIKFGVKFTMAIVMVVVVTFTFSNRMRISASIQLIVIQIDLCNGMGSMPWRMTTTTALKKYWCGAKQMTELSIST